MSRKSARIWRTVLVSAASLTCSAILLITGSYALFTDEISIENHLRAGTLEAKLERTALTEKNLDEDGYLKETVLQREGVDAAVDFTYETQANVFGFTQEDKLVPCCERTATMRLRNDGDVAFEYWMQIKLVDDEGKTTSDEAFAEQLQVSVTTESGTATQFVVDGLDVGSKELPVGTVSVGRAATFTVKVAFLDDRDASASFDNNAAQDGALSFDLVVYAVQKVK